MSITKEEIKGTKILNEIKSSNLKKSEYDTETKLMIVEFANGHRYQYEEVHTKHIRHLEKQSLKESILQLTFQKNTSIRNCSIY